ncbi:MAG: helix-hairpin-helix domain-containing protein [Eubacteriales bacterium]|nr:helix-hairpin-helix domain-containing protein [Eubacteriales bacterium]
MKNRVIEKIPANLRQGFLALFVSTALICAGCVKAEEKAFFSEAQTIESTEEKMDADSNAENTENAENTVETPDAQSTISAEIYVDVCGAVKNPGVYCLPASSRVFEAIELAGGYTDEAAASYVNRAGILNDGQQIYIPTQTEVDQNLLQTMQSAQDASGSQGTDAAQNIQNSGRININRATKEELTTLTGIGEAKAQAIIAYREENGLFSSVEEITNVPGIKGGTYDKIKDGITIE